MSKFSSKSSLAFCALLLAGCSSEERQVPNPYPNASELRLYVETSYDPKSGAAVLSRENGVQLNSAQRTKFEDALSIGPAPEVMAACFIPHHFFRYFDAKGTQVGEVAVCFCCQGVSASGSKSLQTANGETLAADYDAVRRVVAAVGEPTDVLCD